MTDLVKTRRTVRAFKRNVKVSREAVEIILEAARLSPSDSNTQERRFIVVTDEKLLRAIKMFFPG